LQYVNTLTAVLDNTKIVPGQPISCRTLAVRGAHGTTSSGYGRYSSEKMAQKKKHCRKEFFPNVQDRQKLKVDVTPILTAFLTGHGKTRAYLHRFKILENADPPPPCGNGDQTSDHLQYQCAILNKQREIFKRNVIKSGKWPASKQEIISRHLKSFLLFLNSINFDLL
jgi:hypothetical protein